MSTFAITEEEAKRLAKNLRKTLSADFTLDIKDNEAKHALAKILGAKNWQSLTFADETTELFPVEFKNLYFSEFQDMVVNHYKLASHFKKHADDVNVRGWLVDLFGKQLEDVNQVDIAMARAAANIGLPLNKVWQHASYVSVWDGSSTITTSCDVNLLTGMVDNIEFASGEDVEVCEQEFVILDDVAYELEEDEDGAVTNKIGNHIDLMVRLFINDPKDLRLLADQVGHAFDELVRAEVSEDDVQDCIESLDDVIYDYLGGKSASNVNNGGLASQFAEILYNEVSISNAVSITQERLRLDPAIIEFLYKEVSHVQ